MPQEVHRVAPDGMAAVETQALDPAAVKEMLPPEFRDREPSLTHHPYKDARLMLAELARDPALCRQMAEEANGA